MLNCPVTFKRRRDWFSLHKGIERVIRGMRCNRGDYGEIIHWNTQERLVQAFTILNLFRPALDDEYCEFDRKKRGGALNHDLYAYEPKQGVAVVQARQFFRRKANYYPQVRKTYFLAGQNEVTHEFFRQPISAQVVRRAANNRSVDVVQAVQAWMWDTSIRQLTSSVRQGDVLMIPARRPAGVSAGRTLTVADSHVIRATDIRLTQKRCFALDPTMIHAKGQHAPVAMMGWADIRLAREAHAWDFADRVGD